MGGGKDRERGHGPLHLFLGALGIWAIAVASVSAGRPEPYSPFPMAVLFFALVLFEQLPAQSVFLESVYLGLAGLPLALMYLLGSIPVIGEGARIPKGALIAAAILVALSLVFFWMVLPWSFERAFVQVLAVGSYNVAFWAGLLVARWKNTRSPGYGSNFVFHWLLFAWLGWAAFPWMGGAL